ncbi:hypothetical protein DOTSEDRAFT_138389 [Dothistroma septosporum NZE10]|uniref:Uncharacterized protein n=1 Tax=Dothistroma septosporum (strain NZE10 / CBS 128990) TaxID=675120 RepID=M2YJT3_DOTSN|nr:hypothetical protein DOTSEDRAFT_138389 [Dothistroma septosporum NZE10]
MAKNKRKNKTSITLPNKTSARRSPCTLAELHEDQNVCYKIKALIYDLHNMAKDKSCENRTLQTTDPLYISAPYFTAEEAMSIKTAVVEGGDGTTTSLEQDITAKLENFFEKRRASGDCRPCGPHDLVPVYLECFGLVKADLEDEKFISRLKRSGLGV